MKERLQYLFERHITRSSTAEETDELMQLVEDLQNKEDVQTVLAQIIASAKEDHDLDDESAGDILQAIFNAKPGVITHKNVAGVIPLYRRTAFKWIAAASVIIIASLIVYNLVVKRTERLYPPVAQTQDVKPPSNTRAVITLADGSKVYLDSAGNGILAQQNNVNVVKNENGEIVYSPDHQITRSPDISYNTLFNPRGSKVISLTLSDGTKVWLNSESSLKYPIAFNGKAREVEITGEAYFEVKHNSKQPFKVHLPNGSIVEDLGTAFNINAYSDEEAIKTTLIEGSVQIFASGVYPDKGGTSSAPFALRLKPGQQAIQNSNSLNHPITTSPDIDEVTAWKNGRFQFGEKADLPSIMKQVARWYDVDVEYRDNISLHFGGSVSRNVTLSELLKALETTGSVHFKIEGKKIIVTK